MSDRFADLDRPGLDAVQLRAALAGGHGPFARLDGVDETGSTNSDLVSAAAADPEAWPDLSVLTAERQTAGRGRLDRHWTAPAKSSILVSVLFRPLDSQGRPLPPSSLAWLSLLAASALTRTLTERASVDAGIKWPNDVMIRGRKVAGVLAQMVPAAQGTQPAAVVVGTGLNVTARADELPYPAATSLAAEHASTSNRNILLKAYLRELAALYRQFCMADGDPEAVLDRSFSLRRQVSRQMVTIGQRVRAELPGGKSLVGEAEALDESGALMIKTGDGTIHPVAAGDVVHLRPSDSDAG